MSKKPELNPLEVKDHKKAVVVGGGAFGTSIASVLAYNFDEVLLVVRDQQIFNDLLSQKNEKYLPGVNLPSNIRPVYNESWDEIQKDSQVSLLVFGLPTYCIVSYLKKHRGPIESILKRKVPFVSLSKGIDADLLKLPDDLFFSVFEQYRDQFCFLSGPSFAREIVEQQITLVSLAGRSKKYLTLVSHMLSTPYFKLFNTFDIKGVLLGGALKNIIAIAGGIVEGLGYNHNTIAALLTRGIAEMLRFGIVFNCRPETFYGLSGMGDLILTTTGDLSRNKSFGLEIGHGGNPQEIIKKTKFAVEGYQTTKAAYQLINEYDIRASIFSGTYQVLYENTCPKTVINRLMKMEVKFN